MKYSSYILLFALICKSFTAIADTSPQSIEDNLSPNLNSMTLAPMLKKAMPSIVSISGIKHVKSNTSSFPYNNRNGAIVEEPVAVLIGSGVIINAKKGHIATNAHVVAELDEIRVTLSDHRKFEAKLLGQDQASDLALLEIKADNLVEINFADSDKVQVGDFVVAIGNPYGLNHTVTSGIVSALGRTDVGTDGFYDFIQTDAAINFGNSGGGLLNLKGELVGVNTAIISPAGTGNNIGLGLAIPSNMTQSILTQLGNHGHVDRGPLGIRAQDLTQDLAKAFNTNINYGAVIIDVIPHTPAAQANLHVGDIVLKINNKVIKNSAHLRTMIGLLPINKKTKIQYFRAGKIYDSSVVIANPNARYIKGEELFSGLDGVLLEELPNDAPMHGIRVAEVKRATRSSSFDNDLKLEENDVILSANHQLTPDLKSLRQLSSKRNDLLLLQIYRDKITFFVVVKAKETT